MSDDCPIELAGVEPIRKIGVGGFAEVWVARQVSLDRQVALKVGHRPFSSVDDGRRFERECKALGRLSGHPHIIDVHMSGFEHNLPYLVMEYVEGGTLAQHGQSMTEQQLRTVAAQLCDAVQAAHSLGVLHRDLKPENVLLRTDGSAVLGDFGIARLGDGNNTVAGQVTATVAYAPPEILNGREPTEQADIYGIGVTMASAVMGRSPYSQTDDPSAEAVIFRVFESTPPDLAQYGISAPFAGWIHQAMARDPGQRPQGAGDLLHRLTALPPPGGTPPPPPNSVSGGNLTAAVPPPDPIPRPAPGSTPAQPRSSNKIAAATFGIAGLIALAFIGWLTLFDDGEGDEVAGTNQAAATSPTVNGSTTAAPSTSAPTTTAPSTTTPEPSTTTPEPSTTTLPLPPLVIPISSTEVSDLTDIVIDPNGWVDIAGPANSPQFCDVRPDITGLVDTTAALYPLDSTVGEVLQQVTIRMHRFATPQLAANFVESYTTVTCDSWESTEYSAEGITILTAARTEPVSRYGDDTRQVDQAATLPTGFTLLSRSVLVRHETDVMKLVFLTIDPEDLDPVTDRLTARAVESLGY